MGAQGITRAQAIEALWRMGDLRWKLRAHQADIVARFRAHRGELFVVNVSRQSGKTYFLATLAIGAASLAPVRVLYATYSLKATKAILRPTFAEILSDCPRDLRPRFNGQDGVYDFPSGGQVRLAGLDEDRAEDLRGLTEHLVIVDEGGFISDLTYKVRSVLGPMTKTTGGRTIIASTPPPSPGHDFVQLAIQAEAEGAYVKKTIYDDVAVTPEQIEKEIRKSGGRDSVHFRREHMAEFLADEERAVIPEFTEERAKALVTPVPPVGPHHALVAMDVGFEDLTFVVFGYYDFRRATLCVEDEVALRRMTTDDLATAIRGKEIALWGAWAREENRWVAKRQVFSRVSDTDLIVINDLAKLHGLPFVPTLKDNKESQLNELRMWVKDGRLQIDPRCKKLIAHLRSAVWNKNRTDYERSSEFGHYDGVDALVYMLRNAPVHSNPYPAFGPDVRSDTHWVPGSKHESEEAKALGQLFRRA